MLASLSVLSPHVWLFFLIPLLRLIELTEVRTRYYRPEFQVLLLNPPAEPWLGERRTEGAQALLPCHPNPSPLLSLFFSLLL